MEKIDLDPDELQSLITRVTEEVTRRVVAALRSEPTTLGHYNCTGVEFDCMERYVCRNVDDCLNTFKCYDEYVEG